MSREFVKWYSVHDSIPASPSQTNPSGANSSAVPPEPYSLSGGGPSAAEPTPEGYLGLIPGGGAGRRMSALPYSKELAIIGMRSTPQGPRPQLACEPLLHGLVGAPVAQILWVLDRAKGDIMRHFGGHVSGVPVAYLPTDASPSVVHTIAHAAPQLRGRNVLFGFPDITFQPAGALRDLAAALSPPFDVVLGVVPAPVEVIADRVLLTDPLTAPSTVAAREDPRLIAGATSHAVSQVLVKPPGEVSPYAWLLAAWGPRFTRFLVEQLEATSRQDENPRASAGGSELYLGHVVHAAIEAGLTVGARVFPEGSFIDTGTPVGLAKALATSVQAQ